MFNYSMSLNHGEEKWGLDSRHEDIWLLVVCQHHREDIKSYLDIWHLCYYLKVFSLELYLIYSIVVFNNILQAKKAETNTFYTFILFYW